jgi:murein DD-endopeptidase MepM/ murein hydrolase activator NlpD
VVVDAFMAPPADASMDALLSDSVDDATVKQSVVDMVADADAATLEDLQQARDDLEDQQEEQEAAAADADEARDDAEAALAELEGALGQQAQFVLGIRARLANGPPPADLAGNPDLAAQVAALAGAVQEVDAAQDLAEAQAALRRARQEAVARGEIVCPVDGGGLNFIDSWGFSRSGGRSHEGTDMMAASGTPTPAPTNGQVVHRENDLGGLTWYLYGTNGHTYYGAHLSGYENVGAGYVEAGTVIGYVGASGNASGGEPHLHFEYQPGGGRSVNPYEILDRACPGH